jgi:hypothetical protein
MSFGINTLYTQLFKLWRERRFELFLHRLKPTPSDILLDVGGYPGFWISHPQPVLRLDILNIHAISWSSHDAPNHNIRLLLGDGCSLNMPDQCYELGFSNSVIEHVGSWERQQQFASELRRVAKALWVQTPAYGCPLEPHYLAPFVHYLPRSLQKGMLRWFSLWGWIERPTRTQIDSMVETTRLLKKSEMQRLFPDCEIVTERILWTIPKSYIAIRERNSEPNRAMVDPIERRSHR